MTTRQNHNAPIIEEFRFNRGKVGNRWKGGRLLLLGTIGTKSGVKRIFPVMWRATAFSKRVRRAPCERWTGPTSSAG